MVGGDGEAESKIFPSCETAATFGGEGWDGEEMSRLPVESEYACTLVLSVVVKKRVRESGEKSRRRGRPCIHCQYVVQLQAVRSSYVSAFQYVLFLSLSCGIVKHDNLTVSNS